MALNVIVVESFVHWRKKMFFWGSSQALLEKDWAEA